jgi:N-acetylglucosamine-6-sulfatase
MRMPRTLKLLASVGLSMGVASSLLLLWGVTGTMPRKARAATGGPNIVFILADDMRKDDLRYMPKTRALLKDKGMSFENAFVSHALCAPPRATIMRGQYAHNTGVWTGNNSRLGGWQAYNQNGLHRDNAATRLDAAGYRTGLFGKYLNGYQNSGAVPRGWDRWFAHLGNVRYYDYRINDDGDTRRYGSRPSDYETDVVAKHAEAFIGRSANAGKPFFAYLAPKAPHSPAIPAPRDLHTHDGLKAPRPPSFDEQDASDKPPWLRKLPRLGAARKAKIDRLHEGRAETLQALDDLVAGVIGKLRKEGAMGNTYVFFTSDNGWHEGEHRIPDKKWRPYEEDVRMPLLVRGPGVAAGHQARKLALNTDFLPTFTSLAGARRPPYVDGRSLKPVLKGNATAWRSAVLLEAAERISPAYRGIRTGSGTKYLEYASGDKELYRLGHDPHELHDRYPAIKPSSGQVSRLHGLESCAGEGCRALENGQR